MADVDAAKIDAPKAPKDQAPKSSALHNEARDTMMAGFPKAENLTNKVNQWDLSATKCENYPVLKAETPTLDLSVPIESKAKPGEQKKDAPAAKPAATQDAPAKSQESKKEAPASKVKETEDTPAKSQENKQESFKLNAAENHRRTPEEQKSEASKAEATKHRDENNQADERKEKPESKSAEALRQKSEAETADKARQSQETKSAEANQKKQTQTVEEQSKKDQTKATDTAAQKHGKLDTIAEIDADSAKHAAAERQTMNQASTVLQDLPKLSLEGDLKVATAFGEALFGKMGSNVAPTAEAIGNAFGDGIHDQGKKLQIIGDLCQDIGNGKFEKGLGVAALNEYHQLGQLAQDYEEHPTATALRQLAQATEALNKATQTTFTTLDRMGNRAMYDPEQFGLNGVRMIPELVVDAALALATAGAGDAAAATVDETTDAGAAGLDTAADKGLADAVPAKVPTEADVTPPEAAPKTPEAADSEPSAKGDEADGDENEGGKKSEEDEKAEKQKEQRKLVTKVATGPEAHHKESRSEKEQKEAGKLLHHYLPKSEIDVDKITKGPLPLMNIPGLIK
jgi:hypothetical protein